MNYWLKKQLPRMHSDLYISSDAEQILHNCTQHTTTCMSPEACPQWIRFSVGTKNCKSIVSPMFSINNDCCHLASTAWTALFSASVSVCTVPQKQRQYDIKKWKRFAQMYWRICKNIVNFALHWWAYNHRLKGTKSQHVANSWYWCM